MTSGMWFSNSLDHDLVLQERARDLHAARLADGGVRDVAVAADFIGGVDDDDALLFAQHARSLTQQRGLAHARASQQEHALALFDDVLDDVDRAEDGPSHAAGQPDDFRLAVANGRDAVQGALDTRAVVFPEIPDAMHDKIELRGGDFGLAQIGLVIGVTRLGLASEVEHDFQQRIKMACFSQRPCQRRRQDVQQRFQIVSYFVSHMFIVSIKMVDQASGSEPLFCHTRRGGGGPHLDSFHDRDLL